MDTLLLKVFLLLCDLCLCKKKRQRSKIFFFVVFGFLHAIVFLTLCFDKMFNGVR